MAYIDLDSGTIFNGPVVWVDDDRITEDMTDEDARILAAEEPKDQDMFATRMVDYMQRLGYAVIVFTPDELEGVEAEDLANVIIPKGWDYIDMNKEN